MDDAASIDITISASSGIASDGRDPYPEAGDDIVPSGLTSACTSRSFRRPLNENLDLSPLPLPLAAEIAGAAPPLAVAFVAEEPNENLDRRERMFPGITEGA